MKFVVDEKIFEKFPSVTIGAVVAKDVNNSGALQEIQAQLAALQTEIRAKYDPETFSQEPKIDAWRKAYSAFGGEPKKNRSSVENLYRLVLRGTDLRPINKLVDMYNLVSLRRMLPVGGEDLDQIKGNLLLTFAGASEPVVLLLGDKEARPPHPGEVIYKDDVSAVCRRWNWREADRTKLTEKTRNCVLVLEGLSPVTRQEVENAALELKELVSKHCGGSLVHQILDKSRNEMEL